MSNQVALLLVAGLIAAVLLALIMNRRFKAWWGDKGVQAGTDEALQAQKGGNMNMSAVGKGSSIERAAQIRHGASDGDQNMEASSGGKLKGVKQEIGSKENQ